MEPNQNLPHHRHRPPRDGANEDPLRQTLARELHARRGSEDASRIPARDLLGRFPLYPEIEL